VVFVVHGKGDRAGTNERKPRSFHLEELWRLGEIRHVEATILTCLDNLGIKGYIGNVVHVGRGDDEVLGPRFVVVVKTIRPIIEAWNLVLKLCAQFANDAGVGAAESYLKLVSK
jgi:hypothetical protein